MRAVVDEACRDAAAAVVLDGRVGEAERLRRPTEAAGEKVGLGILSLRGPGCSRRRAMYEEKSAAQ